MNHISPFMKSGGGVKRWDEGGVVVLLVLVLEPLEAGVKVFVVGGTCGCVGMCYGGRDVGGGCCGVYLCIGVTLCCVKVDVLDMDWFFDNACVYGLGL